jgi:hypothetical protein
MEAVAEMRFGIVLPTYLYSAERKQMAERSYASLARTEVPEGHRPLRIFVVAANSDSADVALDTFMPSFAVKVTGTKGWILKDDAAMSMRVWLQPPEVAGLDPSIAWLVERRILRTSSSWPMIWFTILNGFLNLKRLSNVILMQERGRSTGQLTLDTITR